MQLKHLFVLLPLIGCTAQMVTPPGTISSSPFAPINESALSGVIKYLNEGIVSIRAKRREDAYRQMYESCRGDYQIDSEGPRVEGGVVVPIGELSVVSMSQYWYIQFSCVDTPVRVTTYYSGSTETDQDDAQKPVGRSAVSNFQYPAEAIVESPCEIAIAQVDSVALLPLVVIERELTQFERFTMASMPSPEIEKAIVSAFMIPARHIQTFRWWNSAETEGPEAWTTVFKIQHDYCGKSEVLIVRVRSSGRIASVRTN